MITDNKAAKIAVTILVIGMLISIYILIVSKDLKKPVESDRRIVDSVSIGPPSRNYQLDVTCLRGFMVVSHFRGGGFQIFDEKGPIRCKE